MNGHLSAQDEPQSNNAMYDDTAASPLRASFGARNRGR